MDIMGHARRIIEGADRLWVNGPYGKETVGGWLERHEVEQTPEGKFVFYHGTPNKTLPSLRAGSYMVWGRDGPQRAAHFAARDRDLKPADIVVHRLELSPDEVEPGVFATLKVDYPLRKPTA